MQLKSSYRVIRCNQKSLDVALVQKVKAKVSAGMESVLKVERSSAARCTHFKHCSALRCMIDVEASAAAEAKQQFQ